MTDDPGAGDTDSPVSGPATPSDKPEEKMSRGFYAALGLVVILVLMIVVANYPAAKGNAGSELAQTNWSLQYYTDATGILIPPQSGTTVTARFDSDGRLSGSAGCNGYGAAWQTRDLSINVTGAASTKMFCPGPGVMDQEMAFLADLSKASSFRVSSSTLKLSDPAGKVVLIFGTE